ncbi:putative NBD/HSP70 family sugar kinase [Streptosporangium becharense]|uniref:Putative NBD/HSP70 family sugar kinase n=1 Tax=Streptosporangium becharense TaxID=1816182 RepID=A0A7W9IMI4_9ACTN|nr:ROK family transcriptional regulator [Streptosporangium becharense]MBB2910298.1 putative NBD/HSP70 family sugar kinase [Streptosporangium becharense]MBB5823041.1 putative NBD/HSP70 family sugar kinase [Streptosporangium becharense]
MTSLSTSARAVLAELVRRGEATRPQVSQALGLSKPTVSAAMSELEEHRLVTTAGSIQGYTGRSALLYRIGESAGHVVGVDVGVTRVRVHTQTLSGRRLLSESREVAEPAAGAATAGALLRETLLKAGEDGPPRQVVIALPTVVSDRDPSAPSHIPEVREMLKALPLPEAPLLLENNVNCAALAEGNVGVAKGASQFGYVQVGVRIGAAVVIGGRLLRGASGWAGEVAHLPFPWAPGHSPEPEGLERYLGAEQLLARTAADWPGSEGLPPGSAEELFQRAVDGSALARRAVAEHATQVGRLLMAVVSLLDPGLIVLGGGIGSNPLLLRGVQETVSDMHIPVEIRQSDLGTRATVEGAAALAREHALQRLIGVD